MALLIKLIESDRDDAIELLKSRSFGGAIIKKALFEAIKLNDKKLIREILNQKHCSCGIINSAYKYAHSVVHLDVIPALTSTKCRIDRKTVTESLIEAARKGHIEVIKLLSSRHVIDTGSTGLAMIEAAEAGYENIVVLLFNTRKTTTDTVQRSFIGACGAGSIPIIKFLLFNSNISNDTLEKGLYSMCQNKHVDTVRYMLNIPYKGSLLPGLNGAASAGDIEIAKLLISEGVEDEHGFVEALSLASMNARSSMIKFLIDTLPVSDKAINQGLLSIFHYDDDDNDYGDKKLVEIVNILLRTRKVNSITINNACYNLLGQGYRDTVMLLLKTGEVVESTARELLELAIEEQYNDIIRTIIKNYDLDPVPGDLPAEGTAKFLLDYTYVNDEIKIQDILKHGTNYEVLFDNIIDITLLNDTINDRFFFKGLPQQLIESLLNMGVYRDFNIKVMSKKVSKRAVESKRMLLDNLDNEENFNTSYFRTKRLSK